MSDYPHGWDPGIDWTERLKSHFSTSGFQKLTTFVNAERANGTVYPATKDVFAAFHLTPFANTRAVILGQDPYHGPNQAHGLSFSVPPETKIPPSLRNIFRELADDLQIDKPTVGTLTPWARQGVFLLNTVLTVRQGEANSHRNQGWEAFTDEVIRQFDNHPERIVFLLWGKPAEKKADLIDSSRHAIITAPHPSPLSAHRGFLGSRPFSKTNELLSRFGRTAVDWAID